MLLHLELGRALPLFTELPRRRVFPETQLPTIRASRKLASFWEGWKNWTSRFYSSSAMTLIVANFRTP
jgi:hypothetical protein